MGPNGPRSRAKDNWIRPHSTEQHHYIRLHSTALHHYIRPRSTSQHHHIIPCCTAPPHQSRQPGSTPTSDPAAFNHHYIRPVAWQHHFIRPRIMAAPLHQTIEEIVVTTLLSPLWSNHAALLSTAPSHLAVRQHNTIWPHSTSAPLRQTPQLGSVARGVPIT